MMVTAYFKDVDYAKNPKKTKKKIFSSSSGEDDHSDSESENPTCDWVVREDAFRI